MTDSEMFLTPSCVDSLRERKRLETRKAIHEACLDLAEERGVSGFTVEEAAERAEISRRTFFNYFASKEDAIFDFDPEDLPDAYRQRYVDGVYASPESSVVLEMVRMYADVEQSRLVGYQPSRMRRVRDLLKDNPKLIDYVIKKTDANFHDRSALLQRRHPQLTEAQRMLALKTVEGLRHIYLERIRDSGSLEYGPQKLMQTYDDLADMAFRPTPRTTDHDVQETP
ncbi:TetR/AcrR family transcriptional regulator [Curtobacterium sp. S6]|uniref:TetR/AcrR family transcriptional regulator n=1 Tax=Curtobacterium sp. S6 TaxID=1479623 RepID=UPI001F2A0A3B|nr:TetR/AcrR family transcriptional regulator [Curtobacterium sp. S6]